MPDSVTEPHSDRDSDTDTGSDSDSDSDANTRTSPWTVRLHAVAQINADANTHAVPESLAVTNSDAGADANADINARATAPRPSAHRNRAGALRHELKQHQTHPLHVESATGSRR